MKSNTVKRLFPLLGVPVLCLTTLAAADVIRNQGLGRQGDAPGGGALGESARLKASPAARDGANPQNQNSPQTSAEQPEPRLGDVIDEAPEPADKRERAKRHEKNRRYDRGGVGVPALTELPPDTVSGRPAEGARLPALPVAQSDAVVLGTVVKAQPYLTESKTSLYTEFTVNIEEVLKNDAGGSLFAGIPLVVDREGGALRLPGDRVVRYEVGGTGRLPRAGKTYVFFLKRAHEGADWSILSGYELRGARILPLQLPSRYDGADRTAFLSDLRAALSGLNKPAQEGGPAGEG